MASIECAGFVFNGDFDSGNFLRAELVHKRETRLLKATTYSDDPDIEFNIWTKPDCYGTPFENGNKTWFYFGIRGDTPHALVKLNIVDVNKQTKMYSQGMCPVTRIIPGNKGNWERLRDRITYASNDSSFTLSFRYFTPENTKCTQYFAFTYPFTYMELQNNLLNMDQKYLTIPGPANIDDIYYVRECVCKSLEGRRIDLITISSYHNITFEKETRLKNLFTDTSVGRPFKFHDKKIIFMSARVHPGETPASFVFNGFLNLLLSRENPFAIALRRLYVFKLIPFLNPDGVAHGHYRTDTRGVNLNRLYLNPSIIDHPSVYAARSIIRYHHHGYERPDDELITENASVESLSSSNCSISKEQLNNTDSPECIKCNMEFVNSSTEKSRICDKCKETVDLGELNHNIVDLDDNVPLVGDGDVTKESGLFLYIDLHGHASKKGIFMYGNHFNDEQSNVECMLLPKIMSINNPNFHFFACNFTERNMYLKDKRDGLSREGSGRVAVLKLTGLVRSYTLECNYNTGRLVNALPAQVREGNAKPITTNIVPPKFTPHIYEEAGKALGPSILDLTGDNPSSRLPNSEFRTLNNMREWLKWYLVGQLGSPTEHAKSLSQVPRPMAGVGARRISLKNIKPNRSTVNRTSTVQNRTNLKNDRKENLIQNKVSTQPSSSAPRKPARSKFTTPTISSHLKTKEVFGQKSVEDSGDFKFRQQASTSATFSGETSEVPKPTKRLRTTMSRSAPVSPIHEFTKTKIRNKNLGNRRKHLCVLKPEFGKKCDPDLSGAHCSTDNVSEWKETPIPKVVTKAIIKRPIEPKLVTTKHLHHFHGTKSKSFKVEPFQNKHNTTNTLKKGRVRKPLRRLTTSTELPFGLIKNKKRKKKKAKFI